MRIDSKSYFSGISKILLETKVTNDSGMLVPLDEGLSKIVELVLYVKSIKGKIMIIGNGGSAAIASHMHNDFSKAIGIQALTFYETPLLTAYSNDLNYEIAFEKNIRLWANSEDILVAISSSGKSKNILRAVKVALDCDCKVLTLSGFQEDNPLRQMGHYNIYTKSGDYGYVEVSHAVLSHWLTDNCLE